MQNGKLFKIIATRQYEKCRQKLSDYQISDLDNILNELGNSPQEPLIKPLKGKLTGKYVVRFAKGTHRLILKINWDSKSILLLYLAARSAAYTGKMW